MTFDPRLLLMYLLAGLLAVTTHEFAHVLLPLRAGASGVRVQLGVDGGWSVARFRLGRVTVDVRPYPFWIGRAHWDHASMTPATWAWAIALGPLSSAALCALGALLWRGGGELCALGALLWRGGGELAGPFGQALAVFAGLQALVTAMPVRYPAWMGMGAGMPSDGRQLLDHWRGRQRAHA
ncbi:hypothetical protein [Deinococcus sp. JMULE3]|uniref:hypothetical protein n=1 Tax=Deinococcus sp. JMULE3 TaxID=2518341 RepID=UPI0015756319|nr:hypothetical protein [Deinococcus sp. JMULE3]NTX99492.1 hypothetical protein [Deinococcus sp. JMULE3]